MNNKFGYLVHYGTPRHSGRYPWGSGKRPKQSLEKSIIDLNKKLNSFNYGVLVDGKIYKNLDNVPWNKYKTLTIEEMDKYKVGICWDFVNYQHEKFKSNGRCCWCFK